eukprot:jgi/Undpi1/13919/HiC_scaffold_9.g03570.m1
MSDNSEPAAATPDAVPSPPSTSGGEDNRIKVVCRVRPPVSRETNGAKGLANRCVAVAEDNRTVMLNSKPHGKNFTFDYAAGEDSTQEELFAEVGRPVTEACLEGYNGTIFCYGQTGSGKTFTTFGPGAVMENHLNPSDPKSYALRGLVPRVLEYLYASIASQVANGKGKVSYSCKCSFYEIFNEKVFDLVDESNRDNPMGLTVREDTRKGVYVEGLMEEEVEGTDAACEILHRGFRNRHVGETAMNRESSRSHAVFTLVIEATEVVEEEGLTRSRVARFNLVDLAGSERQKDTQASGERLKEASNINKSLSTLGQVINALVEKSAGRFRHVNYRDSKLTFLLRDSLGGNSKTMLVAAISPADQNFGETLSTLKFAQRAKMIKNQAVKNEDTRGSFDALRREVAVLRQKLAAAAQQPSGGDGGSGGVPRSVGDPAEGNLVEFSVGGVAVGAEEERSRGVDNAASEALLADALRRARSAESAHAGARRRVEALLSAVEKGEKDALQLKMVIKFRDGTIAAQRKKDADQERIAMSQENAHLLKQLEGGVNESAEVSKWRMQYREAEDRLAELTGDKSGDAKKLVWGVGDEDRFRGELDEKVLNLMEENRRLTEAAEAFEERLHHETRKAEKRRLSAANRAELEAKKIVENALLSKLQEAQGQVEETKAELLLSRERGAALETDKTQQGAAIAALTKQLQEANRRVTEATQDRDVRLADLQSKIEQLSRAKERAVQDNGSEVASLEVKLVGFIKDNSELLRANKSLEEEADGLDRDLETLEAEKKAQEEAAALDNANAAAALASLERRMQQQDEVHEREVEEQLAEKRSVMKDLEVVTERLRSAEEAHGKEVDEQQRRSNDLQERLVETRAEKQQLEGRLKQLQDDYDTLSEQAEFSQGRADDLQVSLERAAEDLRRAIAAGVARACVAQGSLLQVEAKVALVEGELEEANRRGDGQEFFKLAQEALRVKAEEACAEREQEVELLGQELEAAEAYAEGVRMLLEGGGVGGGEGVGWTARDVEGVVERGEVGLGEVALDVGVFRGMVEEQERAEEKVEELGQMLTELVADEDRLVDEIHGLRDIIKGLEATEEVQQAELTAAITKQSATEADLAEVTQRHESVSLAFKGLESVNLGMRQDLASASDIVTELEGSIAQTRAAATEAEARATDLEGELKVVRDSCFEYQARAVAAESEAETLSADVARLAEEVERARVEAVVVAERMEKAKMAAAVEAEAAAVAAASATAAALAEGKEATKKAVKDGEAAVATKSQELEDKVAELGLAETALANTKAELSGKNEELAEAKQAIEKGEMALRAAVEAGEAAVAAKSRELEVKVAELGVAETSLASTMAELSTKKEELVEAGHAIEKGELAMTAAVEAGEEAVAAKSRELENKLAELGLVEAALAGTKAELSGKEEELVEAGKAIEMGEVATLAAVEAGEAAVATKSGELEDKVAELGLAEAALASTRAELSGKEEELLEAQHAFEAGEEVRKGLEEALAALTEKGLGTEKELVVARSEVARLEEGLAALGEETAAKKKELVSVGEELSLAGREMEVVQQRVKVLEASLGREEKRAGAAEEAARKLREAVAACDDRSAREVEAAREEAARLEARLSAEIAEKEAADKRASETEALKKEAEKLAESMCEQVSSLKELARGKAELCEESDAVRMELTVQVVDLKTKVKRLEDDLLSEEERVHLKSDLESTQRQLAETRLTLKATTTRNADLEEQIGAARGQTEGYTAKVMELTNVNASLVGHKNSRQKIQQVQKLKDENNLLSRKLKELDDRLFYIKRAGCGGPGCGRSAAAAAGASSTGVVGGGAGGSSAENESSAASVSSGGSRHSMSPTRRVRGGVGEGGGGSPGKAYNLRRRGKVADEKGVRGVGAPGGGGEHEGEEDRTEGYDQCLVV